MGLKIDLHVHTRRYSPCSRLDPERLVRQGVKAGLDGIVITEHHHQWLDEELAELVEAADAPGFLLLSGFEYMSRHGDLLVYGLEPNRVADLLPGMPPRDAVLMVRLWGGVCIAAHPTRAGMGFDEEILTLPVDAIEVCSTNLQPHEQRLARKLAQQAGKPAIAASDAHHLPDVGAYAAEFDDPIRSMRDLKRAIRRGRFRTVPQAPQEARTT
ncbi:MAG TPA: hypothetical protein ENN80_05770 [Candidatus Hydrogenedentes bacterium]|nr:hypothetical protein [Candidatus Hydrogenedentota bacterium]